MTTRLLAAGLFLFTSACVISTPKPPPRSWNTTEASADELIAKHTLKCDDGILDACTIGGKPVDSQTAMAAASAYPASRASVEHDATRSSVILTSNMIGLALVGVGSIFTMTNSDPDTAINTPALSCYGAGLGIGLANLLALALWDDDDTVDEAHNDALARDIRAAFTPPIATR